METAITIIQPLTEAEARIKVSLINQKSHEIGELLMDMHEREGWRALGYPSWTAFLESDELNYSRKRCLEFTRCFPVTKRLREDAGIELKTEQALALLQFPEAAWIPIAQIAQQHGLTAPRIEAIGKVMTQAIETGHVTLEDGSQAAFEAAYNAERKEGEMVRQMQLTMTGTVSRRYHQDDGNYALIRLNGGDELKTGQQVVIRVKS